MAADLGLELSVTRARLEGLRQRPDLSTLRVEEELRLEAYGSRFGALRGRSLRLRLLTELLLEGRSAPLAFEEDTADEVTADELAAQLQDADEAVELEAGAEDAEQLAEPTPLPEVALEELEELDLDQPSEEVERVAQEEPELAGYAEPEAADTNDLDTNDLGSAAHAADEEVSLAGGDEEETLLVSSAELQASLLGQDLLGQDLLEEIEGPELQEVGIEELDAQPMVQDPDGFLAEDEPVPGDEEEPEVVATTELPRFDEIVTDEDSVLELVEDEPAPAAEAEMDEVESALFADNEDEPAPAAARTTTEKHNLIDELGSPILPTIRDRTAPPVVAAAAVQIQSDGTARPISPRLAPLEDEEEAQQIELPPSDDPDLDSRPVSRRGFDFDVDEPDYEESVETPAHALELTPDADDLSSTGFEDEPVQDEQVDLRQIQRLQEEALDALDRGDLSAAVIAYSNLIDFDPNNLEAYLGRGRCHLDLGDYASAMSDFQKAEDLDPDGPESLVAMGELFFARKEYSRAIEFFDQAIELDASHAMARCRRGISYYYRKSYRQAFLDLQKAYTLDPEIPNIRKYVQMAIKKLERSGEG